MANKPLQSIKFPGLSDTYVVPQIDDTLSIKGRPADAKVTGDKIGRVTEAGRNLLYSSAQLTNVSASVVYEGDNIVVTASSSGTYRTAQTIINVEGIDALTVSWESKESTAEGAYPASIRVGKIVNGTTTWLQYVTSSPTTIDTSEFDTFALALYVAQGQAVEGDYATFTKLQLEIGTTATDFISYHSTALDRVARADIEKIKEELPPTPSQISIIDSDLKILSNTDLWEGGTISGTTGENIVQNKSVRLKDYKEVDPAKELYFQAYYVEPDSRVDYTTTDNNNMKNAYTYQYDSAGVFITRTSHAINDVLTGAKITLNSNCKYVRFAFYTSLSNSDIAVIMPSAVYVDAVGDDMWLPPYYDEYLSEKAEQIQHYMRNEIYNSASGKYEKVYDPDAKLISFLFITDEHYTDPSRTTKYNQMHSPAIIKRLAEKVNIPMVISGGDADQSGLWTDWFCEPLRRAFKGQIHHVVGNHEYLSLNTGTSLYYDMDSLDYGQVGDTDKHYYYVDNPQLKLRIIVLASNMESQSAMGTGTGTSSQNGYTTEQENWVNNIALGTLPTGWDALVFTHFFYALNDSTGNLNISRGTTILQALASNPSVIAVFQGHTHCDRIIQGQDAVAGNLPIVITSCDKNISHTSEGTYPVNRSTGTVFEQLMDVVVVNRSAKTITIIRVGGKAQNGINTSEGSETEIRTVTYGN